MDNLELIKDIYRQRLDGECIEDLYDKYAEAIENFSSKEADTLNFFEWMKQQHLHLLVGYLQGKAIESGNFLVIESAWMEGREYSARKQNVELKLTIKAGHVLEAVERFISEAKAAG